jgi:hypothetical protein
VQQNQHYRDPAHTLVHEWASMFTIRSYAVGLRLVAVGRHEWPSTAVKGDGCEAVDRAVPRTSPLDVRWGPWT